MKRTLLAAVIAACLAITPASPQASPLDPPSLPQGTPDRIDGYSTAGVHKHFARWTRRQTEDAIRAKAELQIPAIMFGFDARALEFRTGSWTYGSRQGAIYTKCDPDPSGGIGSLMGSMFLTDEQKAARCFWQLDVIDAPGAEKLAMSWLGQSFDAGAATAWLASKGIAPAPDLMTKTIDWSGFQDPAALSEAPVLRVRSYGSRNCPAISDVLTGMEDIQLGQLNIEDHGRSEEMVFADKTYAPTLSATVYTVTGGNSAELKLSGSAGLVARLHADVDGVLEKCKPD